MIIEQFRSGYSSDGYISPQIRTPNIVENFCNIFENSETDSIDLFLSRRKEQQDFQFLGKSAIAYYILSAEKANNLHSFRGKPIADDWYFYLFNRLLSSCFSIEQARESLRELSVITFNYDRSLEYFFSRGVHFSFIEKNLTYSREPDYSQVPKIDIRHIYGSIGNYEPSSYSLGNDLYSVTEHMLRSIKMYY